MNSLFATYFTLGLRPSFDLGMNEEIVRLLSVVPIIDHIVIGEKVASVVETHKFPVRYR